jgi:hypothetical protein
MSSELHFFEPKNAVSRTSVTNERYRIVSDWSLERRAGPDRADAEEGAAVLGLGEQPDT